MWRNLRIREKRERLHTMNLQSYFSCLEAVLLAVSAKWPWINSLKENKQKLKMYDAFDNIRELLKDKF